MRNVRVPATFVAGVAAALTVSLSPRPVAAGEDAATHARKAGAEFEAIERAEVAKLTVALDAIIADKALMSTFAARKRPQLLGEARPIFDRLKAEQGITHFYFLEPEPARTCFLRVHQPNRFGDVVERVTFTKAIRSGKVGAGIELGKTAFALRVVKPVREGGKLIGYVELGEEIDGFLTKLKERTGHDYTLFAEKARISREDWELVRPEQRWNDLPNVVLVESTIWNAKPIDFGRPVARLPPDGLVLPEWTDGAKRYGGAAFPIRDAEGTIVAALFVRQLVAAK